MKEVSIRVFKKSDSVVLDCLYSKLHDKRFPFEALGERLNEYCYLAEVGAEVVAFIVSEVRNTKDVKEELGRDAFPEEEKYLEIQELYVAPDFRCQEIGSQLVQRVLKESKKSGVVRSLVYSSNENYAETAKFYEKNGSRMWHIFMTQ